MKLTLTRLEALVWVLIYGGLVMLAVGLALRRSSAAAAGGLIAVGIVVALVGVVLIGVRARMAARQKASLPQPSKTASPQISKDKP